MQDLVSFGLAYNVSKAAEQQEHEALHRRFEISSSWSALEVYDYICNFFPELFRWLRNKYGFDDVVNPGFVMLEKTFSTLRVAEGGRILSGAEIIAQIKKISSASWRFKRLYLGEVLTVCPMSCLIAFSTATTHHISPSVYKDSWNESVPVHISVPRCRLLYTYTAFCFLILLVKAPVGRPGPSTIVTRANSQVDAFYDRHHEGLSSGTCALQFPPTVVVLT